MKFKIPVWNHILEWEKIEGEDRRERESEKRWWREKEEGDVRGIIDYTIIDHMIIENDPVTNTHNKYE